MVSGLTAIRTNVLDAAIDLCGELLLPASSVEEGKIDNCQIYPVNCMLQSVAIHRGPDAVTYNCISILESVNRGF